MYGVMVKWHFDADIDIFFFDNPVWSSAKQNCNTVFLKQVSRPLLSSCYWSNKYNSHAQSHTIGWVTVAMLALADSTTNISMFWKHQATMF